MNWTEKMQTVAKPAAEQKTEWADDSSARVKHPQKGLQMPPGYDAQGPAESFRTGEREGNLEQGYAKLPARGTDDQYTGEHADQFYSDAGGFVERANYLDRL